MDTGQPGKGNGGPPLDGIPLEDVGPAYVPSQDARQSMGRRWWARLMPTLPIAILGIIIILSILAPFITPYDPLKNDLANQLTPPAWMDAGSSAHLLGTDGYGRDVLTRLLYGARVSMSVALFSLSIAVVIGSLVGISAGYFGGWIDSILMRLVDVLLGLPKLLVAIVAAVVLGPSFLNVVLVLGLLSWPRIARLIRGETLALKERDFVQYSRAIGVSGAVVTRRHLLPNVLPTLMVATTLEIGMVILIEASMSFLGAGIPPPQSSWGVMISDGRALISTGWWIALFPGLALGLTVLSSNALGDWLRDYFDPGTRRVI